MKKLSRRQIQILRELPTDVPREAKLSWRANTLLSLYQRGLVALTWASDNYTRLWKRSELGTEQLTKVDTAAKKTG